MDLEGGFKGLIAPQAAVGRILLPAGMGLQLVLTEAVEWHRGGIVKDSCFQRSVPLGVRFAGPENRSGRLLRPVS